MGRGAVHPFICRTDQRVGEEGGEGGSRRASTRTEIPKLHNFFFLSFFSFLSTNFHEEIRRETNHLSIPLFYCLTFVKSLYRLVIIKLFLMEFSFRLDFHNCLKCSQQQWRERERETSLRPFIQTYISITGKEGLVIFGRGGEKVPIMDRSGGSLRD